MKNMRTYLWALLVIVIIAFAIQYTYLGIYSSGYNFGTIELAGTSEGAAILQNWYNSKVDSWSLLDYARANTYMDFLFIIAYAGLLCSISYHLMQREKHVFINELLRWCLPMSLLAGFLDFVENGILLFDMHHFQPGHIFYPSMYVSYPKWILSGLVLFIWIISFTARLVPSRK